MKIVRRSNNIDVLDLNYSDLSDVISNLKNKRKEYMEIYQTYTKLIARLERLLPYCNKKDELKMKLQIAYLKKLREKYYLSGQFEITLEVVEKPVKKVKRKALTLGNEE